MRYGGYIRVSRVGNRDGAAFLSPTIQRERIEGWASTMGYEIAEIREDLDVSGGDPNRKNLTELVERVERGELDGLVVATLDRFARSISHAIALIDRIHKAGGRFVSVADGFDTKTPYGELALNVLLSVGQFEHRRFTENWRGIVERQIKEGRHPGAVPPFGYQRDARGVLVPDERAPLVTEVFRRRATGESISKLGLWLEQTGAKTSHGGPASRRLLVSLLTNRAYLGEARSGDMVNTTAHPPLTDEITFARVQGLSVARAPRHTEGALLAGLIRCQGCRYAMAPAMKEGKRRYSCLGDHGGRRCKSPASVAAALIEPIVEEMFFLRYVDHIAESAGDIAAIEDARDRRSQAERLLTEWRDDPTIQDQIGMNDYLAGLRVRQSALEVIDSEITALVRKRPVDLPDGATMQGEWPNMSVQRKQQALREVFAVVVVKKHSRGLPLDDRVAFISAGALGVTDLPRGGKGGGHALPPFDWPSDPDSAGVPLR